MRHFHRDNMTPLNALRLSVLLLLIGCGGASDSPSTTPDPNHTQARVESNNFWSLSVDGMQIGNGNGAVGRLYDLGTGQRCATGRLSISRVQNPEVSYVRVYVGQNMNETTVHNGTVTVCGTGPVAKQFPRD